MVREGVANSRKGIQVLKIIHRQHIRALKEGAEKEQTE